MCCGNSTNEPIENNIAPIILPEPEEEKEENTDDPYRFLKTKNYDNGANYTNGKRRWKNKIF